MEILVKYTGVFSFLTGKTHEKLHLSSGATCRDLFSLLIKKYGKKMETEIYDNEGRIRFTTLIIVDGKSIQNTNIPLKNGITIMMMHPISGG